MKRRTATTLSALMGMAAAPLLWAQRLPLQVFTRGPIYTAAQMSPDGATLGFVSRRGTNDTGPALFFLDLAASRISEVEAPRTDDVVGAMEIKSFTWVNSHRVIFTADLPFTTIMNTAGTAAVNRDGSHWELISGIYKSQGNSLLLAREVLHAFGGDSDTVLLLQRPTVSIKNPVVLELNTMNGNMGIVADDREGMNGWIADFDGNVRVGVKFDDNETRVIYRDDDHAPWQPLHDFDFQGKGSYPLAIDFDGRTAYVAGLTQGGTWGIFSYDLIARKKGPLIFADETYDVANPNNFADRSALIFSKKKRRLIGVRYTAETERTVWFDREMAQLQATLDQALPNVTNTVTGISDDESKLLVRSWSDRQPGIFYVLNRNTKQLRKVADLYPWVRPSRMARVYPLKFRARDGLMIHGYVTFPPGAGRENLPLVVMPHGGPWVRDVMGYDPLVQFIANRGYAVLQINYRGSPGYGEAFTRAGYRQIGKGIQNDITDGVKWAIRAGIADPRRIAIVGASYGGYSAEWALTNTPDLYRCGVSIAGVSDWLAIIKSRGHRDEDSQAYAYWKDQIGDPETDETTLREISPINYVDRIKAPIFVVHGEDDWVVPVSQSRRLVAELKRLGLGYEEMFRPNEGHSYFSGKDHDELLARIQAFLDKNMQ
jgi:dipeptidyl aminopeptidase/acylaminoacyl peptidase